MSDDVGRSIRDRLDAMLIVLVFMCLALMETCVGVTKASAQVHLSLSLQDEKATRFHLGPKAPKVVRTWVAAVSNKTDTQVVIGEVDLIGEAVKLGVRAYDSGSVYLLVQDLAKRDKWRNAGRILQLSAKSGLVLGVTKIVPMTDALLAGLALFNEGAPHIGEYLVGQAVPSVENFLLLREPRMLVIEPGKAEAMILFSGPYNGVPTLHTEIAK